jgi:hypothetical protein
VSLARCTNNIVESVRKRLSTTHLSVRSILHLHSLIREPALIVDSFVQLTAANIGAKDDACFLSRLFDIVQQQQHRSGWLRPLLVETLARVSRPWLEFVEQWIGLNRGPGGVMIAELIRKGQFVQVEEVSELDEAGKERKIKNYVCGTNSHQNSSIETNFSSSPSIKPKCHLLLAQTLPKLFLNAVEAYGSWRPFTHVIHFQCLALPGASTRPHCIGSFHGRTWKSKRLLHRHFYCIC